MASFMAGAGDIYITGYTAGSLGGPNAGEGDAFLAKYDASGALLWMRQMGTLASDSGRGVGVDGAGNAYVAGYTYGSLGGPNAGGADAFLAKYDSSGTLLWTRQAGTSAQDAGYGVAVDSAGTTYIVGTTEGSLGGPNAGNWDAFIAKYDASGAMLWMRQTGSSQYDSAHAVAVDSAGNAYIAGSTNGSPGDAFLAKYDASGTLAWTRRPATAFDDYAWGVAVDGAGNVYITGMTAGGLGGPNAGGMDVYLAKYDASGTLLWTRQTGVEGWDVGYGVTVDGAGHAHITGTTRGSLGGPSAGNDDYFLAKYDASGAPLWIRQAGTPEFEHSSGVAVDGAGNAYIAGFTEGSLGGPNAGGRDILLAKYGRPSCYANCDGSTGTPVLDVSDFVCFLSLFVATDPYANCDGSTTAPMMNVLDFTCFLNAFAAGCP
jgi:hypothetical protein